MTHDERLAELRIDIHVKAQELAFTCIKSSGLLPSFIQEIVDYTGFVAKYNPD